MTIAEIRKKTGMSRAEFCRHFGIPVRTMEDWEHDRRKAPNYVVSLLDRAVRQDYLYKE